jgi:hypothetical protein
MIKRFSFVLILILLIATLIPIFGHIFDGKNEIPQDFFFGVSIGADTASETIAQIDKVKGYTNFLIVNSWEISTNQTALNEICWHAYKSGLSFIVFFDFISLEALIEIEHGFGYEWHHEWVSTAKDRWGDQFLGIYIYEEPGGKQIDTGLFDEFYHQPDKQQMFDNITSYSEAAGIFVNELPKGWSFHYLQNLDIDRFVSDYALYWFDYLAGYNTVFAELGFNHSTPKHIGLCRAAARTQNKDWGTIIVWKSRTSDLGDPEQNGVYKSGPEMYKDMIDSFEAGAKYVIIFNFPTHPPGNPYGILTEEHFSAMKQFWNYASTHPEAYGKTAGDVVYVLPKDYGWGMRRIDDNVWLPRWGPDELSPIIWEELNILIEKYGLRLDIVYDDPHFVMEGYNEIYYSNEVLN